MAKLTLSNITSGYLPITTVNANWDLIETAIENTLSRDGTSPNTMSANFDMNSHQILNITDAVNNQDVPSYAQLLGAVSAIASGNIVITVERQTATASQTSFTLSSAYIVASNNLDVFVNGLRVERTLDYTETNTTTVTFLYGLTSGDQVTFKVISTT